MIMVLVYHIINMDVNEKTLKIFKGFINDLIKVFPEHKESLEINYNDVLNLDELMGYIVGIVVFIIAVLHNPNDPNKNVGKAKLLI